MAKRVKAKLSKEERESGGGESDLSETERLVKELIVLSEESEKRNKAKREAMANEKKQALEMRDKALERLGETRKRNEEEKEEEKQTVTEKMGRSGGETLEWLRQRAAVDTEMKERERKEKQKHYIKEMEAMRQQQNEQVKLMQQQQQQSQALLAFLQRKN